ncbi:uncharacterized protein LOC106088558 [Stomoxys calcitrans]|uniref:uncharacterized protein LOC106088558 n=1 Tax=Stomoxys calcitrans TaxID=35570 RepID=UPI0027E229FD|nr:uncharacterized protein LOC106088558 [Stomoxys calcitrans]
MFSLKCVLLLASCVILVASSPVQFEEDVGHINSFPEGYEVVHLSRHARSPQHGSVDIGYSRDQRGREASVQYNHNLYTSRDGRGSIDAYAQGSRNFDHNRNNFGGGIQGKWRF